MTCCLCVDGEVFGALAVLLPRGADADDEERSLLMEISAGLGFALRAIETERSRAEAVEQLRASEARLRSLAESSVEGIALHELVRDAAGCAVDYRIIEVNPAFERHTGIAAARARGALASEVYGANAPPYLDRYVRVVEMREPTRFDVHFDPLGRDFRVSVFAAGQDTFATVFEDVTDRRQAQRAAQLSEARLAALHELAQREFVTEANVIDFALEKMVELTGSEIGYFHFVEHDEAALSLFAWSKRALEHCSAGGDRHYPLERAGIWADCIRLRRGA